MLVQDWTMDSQTKLRIILEKAMKEQFKVAIVGGRSFTNQALVVGVLDKLLVNKRDTHSISIINGGAKGADNCGKVYGLMRQFEIITMEAAWRDLTVEGAVIRTSDHGQYNARAGYDRNQKMREEADAVVAFWDGSSRGTKEMIEASREMGIPVRVIQY